MSLPILNAADPTIVPAKTFDKWWVNQITIKAPNPNGDATAEVVLMKFRTDENNIAELSSETIFINLDNILTTAQTDQELGAAVYALMSYIMKIGIERGIVKT
jgi:hypothetical protein